MGKKDRETDNERINELLELIEYYKGYITETSYSSIKKAQGIRKGTITFKFIQGIKNG